MQAGLFGDMHLVGNRCSVELKNGTLIMRTPYDSAAVAAIRTRIPGSDRRWDGGMRAWLVDPSYAGVVTKIINEYWGEVVTIPVVDKGAGPELRALECHYIGTCKQRDNGESTAYGIDSQDNWRFVFPEAVLRAWFESAEQELVTTNLYALLGVRATADATEIQSGYRRMARQWHPDICKEPNAHEVFLRIKDAYQILSNTNARARYDAGLTLERSLGIKQPVDNLNAYRSPLRCGMILAEGTERMGRFHVGKILAWEDITNARGQILVSSWVYGDKTPTRVWA